MTGLIEAAWVALVLVGGLSFALFLLLALVIVVWAYFWGQDGVQ